MTDVNVTLGADALSLSWPDGGTADYPYIWLRDNCPSGLHPDTQERMADLTQMPEAPVVTKAELAGPDLNLIWGSEAHQSRFPLTWLQAFRPGQPPEDPAAAPPIVWRSDLGVDGIPGHQADAIAESDEALAAWMRDTGRYGISIVEGVAAASGAGRALAERIGFLRRTNFGVDFEVVNKPDPNNLAYTAVALPLHTDLPNQEVPPGYQFLHCIANEAEGGGSLFADGYAMAEDLRQNDSDAFDLLSTIAIPFRFHDGETDLRIHRPVITLDPSGAVIELRWNAHLAGVFDMEPGLMVPYYRAYRAFMQRTRDPAFQVTLKLQAGEMVVFDNRRVLHGREAFDPSTGFRHLQGCYVDRGEFDARLRVLART